MDERRFDSLVRVLASGLSRRRTLAALGAVFASSAALSVLPEEVAALSKKQRRRCRRAGGVVCSAGTKQSQCCSLSGVCVNGACACDDIANDCPTDATGQCQCLSAVGGVPACADSDAACNSAKPCTTNDQCDPGTACSLDCQVPAGSFHCTNPCIPA
jgi:hypothetical protein